MNTTTTDPVPTRTFAQRLREDPAVHIRVQGLLDQIGDIIDSIRWSDDPDEVQRKQDQLEELDAEYERIAEGGEM